MPARPVAISGNAAGSGTPLGVVTGVVVKMKHLSSTLLAGGPTVLPLVPAQPFPICTPPITEAAFACACVVDELNKPDGELTSSTTQVGHDGVTCTAQISISKVVPAGTEAKGRKPVPRLGLPPLVAFEPPGGTKPGEQLEVLLQKTVDVSRSKGF